jgi:hypothetical protein
LDATNEQDGGDDEEAEQNDGPIKGKALALCARSAGLGL